MSSVLELYQQMLAKALSHYFDAKLLLLDVPEFSMKSKYGTSRKEALLKLRFCDRILWYGRGLHQMSYVRGESRFSDHRPVYSIFLAEVESINHSRFKRRMSCSSSRIEVEELLPYSYGYGELNFFRDMEQY
ncbi:type IV inositol polyphosphate 5-phosphatase 6-like [Daucus carota subsp. sativus]|uniref:type IV inositol polyphosphate 5-phosphatase 6-like n=1 Tax=Daucus carota subsp. sativus TaxID=79200 RepID=UPI003082A5E6